MVTMARPKAEARGASTLGRPPAWQDQLRSLHFLQKLPTAAGPPWTKPHSSSITRGLFSFCFNLKLQGNFKLPAEAISEIADNHLTGFASIPSCQGGGAVQAEPERGHLLGSAWKLQLCFPQLGRRSLAESQKTLGGLPDPCPHLLCSSRQAWPKKSFCFPFTCSTAFRKRGKKCCHCRKKDSTTYMSVDWAWVGRREQVGVKQTFPEATVPLCLAGL